jgi:hypothetical protein
MGRWVKLRNIERDPRVVLSFDAPREPGVFLKRRALGRDAGLVRSGNV